MKRTKLVYVNKNEDIEKKVQETLNPDYSTNQLIS